MKAGVRKRGLLGRLWARTASICADLTMKASRLGFFRTRGRVQINLCSLSVRPSFADKDKRPRVRLKKPARERRVGIKEETALANAPTKPTPSTQDAIAAQEVNTRNLPRNLAHDAPRVRTTTRSFLAPSFLRLRTTLPFALALARVTF